MEKMGLDNKYNKSHFFWKNKRVLITGHTGFKGAWLSIWLYKLGAKLFGISDDIPTDPSLYKAANVNDCLNENFIDINDTIKIIEETKKFKPEIVIHLAAQSLVNVSFEDPVTTYKTNIIGTANVLEACRLSNSVKVVLIVTSDKCYDNLNDSAHFNEESRLGGCDPYSSSKSCAELVTNSYRNSYFKDSGVGIATARAGNVIGGGDWASQRLIPDTLYSLENGVELKLRYPSAVRPWQYVLEPLCGYLTLCEKLFTIQKEFEGPWNFGPGLGNHKSVKWIVDYLGQNHSSTNLVVNNQQAANKEKISIFLNSSKAQKLLNWKTVIPVSNALDNVLHWHETFKKNKNMLDFCVEQINQYEKQV